MIIDKRRSTGLIAFLLLTSSLVHAVPTAISDLTATEGTSDGTIFLQWTAPAGGATKYIIKFLTSTAPITTEGQFITASRIEEPPVEMEAPSPASSGTPESFTVEGLAPGSDYSFSIKSEDGSGVRSPLSNATTAQAKAPCGLDINDGKGSASIAPGSIETGKILQTTITFITDAAGIQSGGKIILQVPDFFPAISTIASSNPAGFLAYATDSGATFTEQISGQKIILTVDAGSLSGGTYVKFFYSAQTCQLYGTLKFRIFTQHQTCGISTELDPASSTTTLTTTSGTPAFLAFEPYQIVTQINVITPIEIRSKDFCGSQVLVPSDKPFTLSTVRHNGANFIPDTNGSLSLLSDMSVSSTALLTPAIIAGNSSLPVYYRITSTASAPNYILLSFDDFSPPYGTLNYLTEVRPLTTGITNSSVDKGTFSSSQKTVTFNPGSNERVFVNFKLPDDLPWEVIFSTDGFASSVKTLYGYGKNVRTAWDGYINPSAGEPGGIAAPGSYSIRIKIGSTMFDDTCSVTLQTSGIRGTVIDPTGPTNLEDVNVEIFGPTNRYTRSLSDGTFKVYGLAAGNYSVRFFKTGYVYKEVSNVVVVGSSATNIGSIQLTQAAILRLFLTRQPNTNLPDVTGGVYAYTPNFSKQAFGSIRFRAGRLTSDAGDDYNSTPTGYTDLNLDPSTTYHFRIEVPGFAPATGTASIGIGVTSSTINLSQQPMIEGTITLPIGTNMGGVFASIEAAIDANGDLTPDSNDPSRRLYGGVYLPANELTGSYRVFGASNGKYVLRTSVPGFIPRSINAIVSGNNSVTNANFPTLSEGGNAIGTVTVAGNSTILDGDNNDGFFEISINAYSQNTGMSSFAQLQLSENATTTQAPYQLKGLADGVYQVFVYAPGFGVVPPGPKSVTVTSGTGTLNLTLEQFTGQLTGSIELPAGQSDYGTVEIDVLSYSSMGGENPEAIISGNTYSVSNLGTGFYTVRARYPTTGMLVSINAQVTNGQTTTRNMDLSGDTYSITGRVTSSARAPFTLAYIVDSSTPTPISSFDGPSTLNANRITAKILRGGNFNSGPMSGNEFLYHDPKETSVGLINSDGEYTISGLAPGAYELMTNGEMDGNLSNGNEISVSRKIVYVSTHLPNQDFTLTDGFTVSGTLRIASGVNEPNRNLQVGLRNNEGEMVSSIGVNLSGTSANFTITNVSPGTYVLAVLDSYPKKYASKDIPIKVVSADVPNQEIQLLNASVIKGKLRIKKSGAVISSSNFEQFLPEGFSIEARSNPHIPGGVGFAENPIIDSNGYFNIAVNPGTYDVLLHMWTGISESDLASGKFQPIPVTISAVSARENEVKDIGFVTLSEGVDVTGTLVDGEGNPLPNIRLEARPAAEQYSHDQAIEAFSDSDGKYVLRGLDPDDLRYYYITAAPYPDPFDTRYAGDPTQGLYAQFIKGPIDVSAVTSVNFTLEEANSSIVATIVTSDGGQLLVPFGEESSENLPGAVAILNKQPNIPRDNPLGDIESAVSAAGRLNATGLAPGVYNLYILAQGYGSITKKDISVGVGETVDLGILTSSAGFTVSGNITKTNGESVNSSELETVMAARDSFNEIAIGKIVGDASGNILEYSISGIQPNRSYSLLGFGRSGNVMSLASNFTLTSNTELDLTYEEPTPGLLTRSIKNEDDTFTVYFKFDDTLRNSDIDLDNDEINDDDEILTLSAGGGELSDIAIASNRKEVKVTYTPVAGDTSFSILVTATFVSLNSTTGENNTLSGTSTFFSGISKQNSATFTNANGGSIDLSESDDGSSFTATAGFLGDDETQTANIILKAADTQDDLAGQTSISSKLGALKVAKKIGMKSYPSEMAAAMSRLETLAVSPLSSFYDIFLPAGVSHFFPEGKEARLCLTYDSSAPDPSSLNIYYFNSATNEYLLESENKTVDTENEKICVNIGHASVFTVLSSSTPVITGGAYDSELAILNFPNPFNLKLKTVTLQDPDTASATQDINGTLIKLSIPSSMSGAVEIKIYGVAGDLIRTIETTVAGGAHYYLEWNGRNESGEKVASGTYIARFTIGGSNEKFFKMVVLK